MKSRRTPHEARVQAKGDFVHAHLQSALRLVEQNVTRQYVDPATKGEFHGRSNCGADLTAFHLANHAPQVRTSWVTATIRTGGSRSGMCHPIGSSLYATSEATRGLAPWGRMGSCP